MAIRMMVSKDRYLQNPDEIEVLSDYPGAETKYVRHWFDCPHRDRQHDLVKREDCHENCKYPDPLYMETTYRGCVLDTGEYNGRDDSDFYAVVWDEATQTIKRIQYATTRGWTYPNNATIDATEEVKVKAEAHLLEKYTKAGAMHWLGDARNPYSVGKVVKVTGGRKVMTGFIGQVIDLSAKSFGWNQLTRSVHLMEVNDYTWEPVKDAKGRFNLVWVNAAYCEVVDPWIYLPEPEEVIRYARQCAAQRNWRGATSIPGFAFM